jgi:hypothetical protein
MDVSRLRSARGTMAGVGKFTSGLLYGVPLFIFGCVLCLLTVGDTYAELTGGADRGTFTVQECKPAAGGKRECVGTYRAGEGDTGPVRGRLTTTKAAAAGTDFDAEPNNADFVTNTYHVISKTRLGGTLAGSGLSVVMLGVGVFSVLTGYAPRAINAYGDRYFARFEDRRRVTFPEAWNRLPGRRVVAPVLGTVTGAGVLGVVVGLVMCSVG